MRPRCSFCGKSAAEVRVVLGPTVNICEECVAVCAGILAANKTTGPCAIGATSDIVEAPPTDRVARFFASLPPADSTPDLDVDFEDDDLIALSDAMERG